MSCPFPFPHPEAHAPPRKRNLLEVQENQSSGWQVHSQGGGRGTRSITQPTSLSLSLSGVTARSRPMRTPQRNPPASISTTTPSTWPCTYGALGWAMLGRNLVDWRWPWWNPPACRRVWLEGVVLVSVLGLYLFLCSLAARFCFVWIKVTHPPHPHPHPPYSYSDAYSDSESSTPLLLPPFFPKYYLVVPVANDIAYSITVVYSYSSQDATVLID